MKPCCPCITEIVISLLETRSPSHLAVLTGRQVGLAEFQHVAQSIQLTPLEARAYWAQCSRGRDYADARCVPADHLTTLCGRLIGEETPTCYPDCKAMQSHPLCPECLEGMLKPRRKPQ